MSSASNNSKVVAAATRVEESKMMKLTKSAIIIVIVASIVMPMIVSAGYEHQSYDDHKHHKFHPYKYGYKVVDHKGNKQWKQEESHSPMEVKGSYGFKDKHGLFREVSYVADKHGFRAHVKTNEPGTAPKNPAAVKMDAHPDPSHHGGGHGHGHGHGHH